MSEPKRRFPREQRLVSPCCRASVALFGGALVEPRAEDVRLTREGGAPLPAYLTGGVHWCARCGTPWLMRDLILLA